jgi:hypothetical protein
MMTDTKSSYYASFRSESMRSVSLFSSHRLAVEIRKSNYAQVLEKSDWIVAIAQLLEDLPFPMSILAKDPNHTLLSKTSPTMSHSTTGGSTLAPGAAMVFYGNSAFVQMVGYSREQIAQHSYEKYLSPPSGVPTPPHLGLADAIDACTLLRVGIMFFPQPPLLPFLNLQSYLPLLDPEGGCHCFLVLHCDLRKHHQHREYLQKLDILTEILSRAILPHREQANTFLKSHFYTQSTPIPTHS